MPIDAVFDARQVVPQQGGGKHPVGNKFPFKITACEVKPVKDKNAGLFEVEFTSPAGSIKNNYNLWNDNETARKIANQELSALCHATGIFQLDFKNDGRALLNGQGLMDVGFQKGHESSAEKPEGGYVEIKKVYDMAGNEPGKGPAPQQQQPQQNQPQTQQGGPQVQSSWSNGTAQQQPQQTNQQSQQQGWGGPQQTQQPQTQQSGWQQNASGQQQPPWGQ